jgi:hypothetical protein
MHDRYDACRCTKYKIFMGRKTGVGFPPGEEICLCTTMHLSSDAKIRICGAVSPLYIFLHSKGKGKAVPVQAWGCPEGSRKLRFPDFLTTAQDGGKIVSLTHQLHLPPGNTPITLFC